MTNKQYEHFGRGVEKASLLARRVEELRELKTEVQYELSFVIGEQKARETVTRIMIDVLPHYRLGDIVSSVADMGIAERKEK